MLNYSTFISYLIVSYLNLSPKFFWIMDDCGFYLSESTDDGVMLGTYLNLSKSAGEESMMGFARL